MERIHFVAPYLLNPHHRITVHLVGCGGTGSTMLNALARIDHALYSLGGQGLHVTTWDPDTVSESNIGRQLFATPDIGQNKAECLTTKINRFYGLDWVAKAEPFPVERLPQEGNIIITAVDNVKTRREIGRMFDYGREKGCTNENRLYYWLDIGNTQKGGQAVLGSRHIIQPKMKDVESVPLLASATDMFSYSRIKDKDSGPSCSLADALEKQDLFINSTLVQMSGSLLWKLLHEGRITEHGFFLNLDQLTAMPIRL